MAHFEVALALTAENDIRNLYQYIAHDLCSPAAGEDHLQAIDEALAQLEDNPQLHPLVRDERLAALGYRWTKAKRYTIFYTIDAGAGIVNVARVLYARRNWAAIL